MNDNGQEWQKSSFLSQLYFICTHPNLVAIPLITHLPFTQSFEISVLHLYFTLPRLNVTFCRSFWVTVDFSSRRRRRRRHRHRRRRRRHRRRCLHCENYVYVELTYLSLCSSAL